MAAKTDRRIIQTKEKIKGGMLSLIEEKPIEKLTVKEICEKANVTRGTFYAHYENEYDLLKNMIVELLNNAFDIIDDLPGGKYSEEEKIDMLTNMFDYLKDNDMILRCAIRRRAYPEISVRARDYFNRICKIKSDDADADRINVAYMFTGNGIMGLVNSWIDEGYSIDSRKLALYFKSIIDDGIKAFIQNEDE